MVDVTSTPRLHGDTCITWIRETSANCPNGAGRGQRDVLREAAARRLIWSIAIALVSLVLPTVCLPTVVVAGDGEAADGEAGDGEAAWLHNFRDGGKHYRDGSGQKEYARYPPRDVRAIADNLLRYQRTNGGWPKNFDPLRILSPEEQRQVAGQRDSRDTTLDNRATYPEVLYLAHAFGRTGERRFAEACQRGLEFILSAQYPNGGWPHTFPNTRGYYGHITILDDVMVGILSALRQVDNGHAPNDFIDRGVRERCGDAIRRGDDCLLRMQVVVAGQPTGWSGQYDSVTLRPAQGRSFEPPGRVSAESVGVLRYLMRIDRPSAAVRRAIEGGTAWLERAKIKGLRIERVPAPLVRYANHTTHDDVVAIDDPDAPPIWARFYELDTNRPFMANRDGKKVFRLADVERERRTGYSWYGNYARDLLNREYPAWCKKWAAADSGGEGPTKP